MATKQVAFALLGPTASGKSRLAMQLAAQFSGTRAIEIVSVDSAQVYRGMDIGTAKPSAAERASVPHHLIDIADPTERYSAGRFRRDALQAIEGIFSRQNVPLLVGGSMLYYRALAQGLDELPAANPKLRAQIDREATRRGWPTMHAELARVDPKSAARLQLNDAQRIQRALEVYRITGRPLSALLGAARAPLPFELKAYSILPSDRAELHARIEARFEAMLERGLVEELRALRARYALSADLPSMRAVSYRQAWEFLEGRASEAQMRERAIAATRQLAKRQLTWLRGLPRLAPGERLAAAIARGR
ncbi:MAG: tRNA (adenosine(37)-N6)-dimethylallyltransferase MiaA [Betaproteobacteria bacterium]|nr:tRNA (adenosine(37)-N6)-dimethylallyltransferase MiaA [Betaproteobacteria bacterium]